ncbi:MAG: hypothetical protein VW338_08525 [Rhodospirillaceae bacterium]
MIYLTPCGPASPATIFINLEDTRRMAAKGYAFPVFSDRIEDINSLLGDGEEPAPLSRPELAAGDATIFDAARILHRGHVPEGPYRDVVLLNILPSLNPWQAEFQALDDDAMFTPRATLWINPFLPGMPRVPIQADPPVPDWAAYSHFSAN